MNRRENRQKAHHHQTSGEDALKAIIHIILAFIMFLAFIGLTVVLVVRWSCFSRSSFYDNMASNDYYNYVQSDIHDNAEAITLPTGLPLEVLKDTIDLYEVHQAVNGYIDAGFTGDTYTADTKALVKRLEENIRASLTDAGITPDQEQEENIGLYLQSIADEYTKKVQMPLLSYFMKARNIYNRVFPYGIAGCLIIILITLFLIIKTNRWFHRSLRFITYSTLSAALMTAVVPAVILHSGFYKRVNLSPQYFYNFAMTYITNLFKTFLYFSLSWFILSVLLLIGIQIIKSGKKHQN